MMRGHSNFKMGADVSPMCGEGKPSRATGVGSSSAFKPYGNTSCSPIDNFHMTNFIMGELNEDMYHYKEVQPF